MMKKALLLSVFAITAFSYLLHAQRLSYKVAENNLGVVGESPHLWESTENYKYSEKEIPFNILDENSPFRTVVLGSEYIVLKYTGIEKNAKYVAELSFITVKPEQIQQILVDGKVVKTDFALTESKVIHHEVIIPKEATTDGEFDIIIKNIKGDWATLSTAIIRSNSNKPLKAKPLLSSIIIPRISPMPFNVTGVEVLKKSLDGIWKFNPKPDAGFEQLISANNWSNINVPGEWAMQGFNVDSAKAAAYFRTFTIPADWQNKRIKLRFNSVYSDATVYINGKKAGSHLGGFTAFELDITGLVQLNGQNTLTLSVINESLENTMSSGSRYACHPLGGIPRSVTLFALPNVNISSLAVQTTFDEQFNNATLTALINISNEIAIDVSGMKLKFELSPWKSNEQMELSSNEISVEEIGAGKTAEFKLSVPVTDPEKWDCETPNLYMLTCHLEKDGIVIETIKQRFGFRQSEVKGNQLFINGMPVKLRGVNRHEVYPLTGRSIPKEMYRKDILLFREGNVNHIRTCHYPPDEALIEAADELGMFIECEGPFCWSHETKGNQAERRKAIIQQNLEMTVLNRNHPSIIFWSLANESNWNNHYAASGKILTAVDPSRPLTFNYFPWSWIGNRDKDEHICQIGSDHYPGPGGPSKYEEYSRPISFGEFVHLNAYNRFELATDVALRDKWGIYLDKMWEDMYKSKGCLGGSIWAGIDDTFYWDFTKEDGTIEERTVGYGTWGPIDGWRRPKPEWWGMKKTYSPIRISKVERIDGKLVVDVENRQDFSNLNRLKITWKIGDETAVVSADIKAKSNGQLIIQPKENFDTKGYLELVFDDPRGFNIDTFKLPLKEEEITTQQIAIEKYKLKKASDKIVIKSKKTEYVIDVQTGLFNCNEFTGPYLMILPLNKGGDTQMHGPTKYYEPYTHTCTDWELTSIDTEKTKGLPTITVKGKYKEAEGTYTYKFNTDGTFTIDYDFVSTEEVNPRQLGIVFEFPKEYENLSWKRKGYWTTYPDWHIARLEGTAKATEGFEASAVGPRKKPNHEWRHDRTKIGSNDFASTKHTIYKASLTNESGQGLEVMANANKHIRSWNEGDMIRMLIANYSNGGNERFLRVHVKIDDRPLKIGDKISGTVLLRME